MAKRGELTPGVQAKAVELLGREITQVELRLIPYVHYALLNARYLDPRKTNAAEKVILDRWQDAGHITVVGDQITNISRWFYDAMNELLWLGYVTYEEQEG